MNSIISIVVSRFKKLNFILWAKLKPRFSDSEYGAFPLLHSCRTTKFREVTNDWITYTKENVLPNLFKQYVWSMVLQEVKIWPPKIEFQGQLSLGNTGLNKCAWQFSPYCQVLGPLAYKLEAHMNVAQTWPLHLTMELFYGKSSRNSRCWNIFWERLIELTFSVLHCPPLLL